MYRAEAAEEYAKALKEGQRELKERTQKGLPPHPSVLDELLCQGEGEKCVDVGLVNIPTRRIVGTKTAGRVSAMTAGFRPLLGADTEFGAKWINLCADHLSDTGIHEPIECYEYLGYFYVQEGNKRVSVLRHFGAPQIAARVKRIMPAADDSPRTKAYYEFLDFYKLSGIYDVQFTVPGGYTKLLSAMGAPTDAAWGEDEKRRFRAYYYCFADALAAVSGGDEPAKTEDALLLWLEVHEFSQLGQLSFDELKKTLVQLRSNLMAVSDPEPVVKTEPPEEKNILVQILKGTDHLNVAFIHQRSETTSRWTQYHEGGRRYMEEQLGKAVTCRVYDNANTAQQADALIEQAVEDGAEVVFTTAPQLIGPCMKGSVNHPRVRFFNCSVHRQYASVRTYYSRIYEAKFIIGAIAGAMSRDGRIGYVGSYPIHGVPASINAFALGAQLTNPNAVVTLKWACTHGNPTRELLTDGIRVISNRDTPVESQLFTEYGTYMADDSGQLHQLAAPFCMWGQYYEHVVRSIINGNWEKEKAGQIVNLWWGMSNGVLDVSLSPDLPEGVRFLAETLKAGIRSGALDPFARRITAQDGSLINDGSAPLSPVELLQMDRLCENVDGVIPGYEEILPSARPMIDLLGISTVVREGSK